jgi:hypothetical protein
MQSLEGLRAELVPALRAAADQIEADLRAQSGHARPVLPSVD